MPDFNFIEVRSENITYDFNFGADKIVYKIIRGTSNNFNSIWADHKASLHSGRFYVGRTNDLSIINNKNRQIISEDYYAKTSAGSSGETLNSEDTIDINVTY